MRTLLPGIMRYAAEIRQAEPARQTRLNVGRETQPRPYFHHRAAHRHPAVATLYLLAWLIGAIDRTFGKPLRWLIPDEAYLAGMGIVVAVVLVFAVGVLMHGVLFSACSAWRSAPCCRCRWCARSTVR